MPDQLELSVVIPVFNEGSNIEETLHFLKASIPILHEVIIVYDRDDDDTLPAIRPIMDSYERLHVVKNLISPGPSGALRTGFGHAKAYRVLVVMADHCDDFTQITRLLSLVPSEADIACPSRYCAGGVQQLKPSLKVWAPKVAGRLVKWLTGMPTYDPTNSYKLYSASVLRSITLTSTVSFSVTLEIMAKAHCLGYRIVEVPTVWSDRQHGKSNFDLRRALFAYFPWLCLALLRGRFLRLPQSWLQRLFASHYRTGVTTESKQGISNEA